ncbi:type III PLP-dependent enzyme [Methylosinus sp. KRF6]|uniref:type III PLP-dependent enzyme n=1 Tax=Methylosinus sp. KRF6 TaxID=2846853 RepID=UPI001C0D4882|nr:type III PLP-dependent enzyme [Methylosinus sp. KRF6]MBU3891044.1 type III PLP-dependent enzyme [Methylosinus sp. KRF6]
MDVSWDRLSAAALGAKAAADGPWCGYIYDLEALRRHARRLVASLPPNCELFYAVKANSEAPVLEALNHVVAGFEVASGGELAFVRGRFPHAPLVFGGPGKTDAELEAALAMEVERVHVESRGELERLAYFARRRGLPQTILLRINLPLPAMPDAPLAMGGCATPFGIDAALLPDCLAWLRDRSELRLAGFHLHLMSGQLEATKRLELVETCLRAVRDWRERYALEIHDVNLGGGMGVNYRDPAHQFDWETFARGLRRIVERNGMDDWRIRFEPGRYVAAACGVYAMEVLDIKRTFGRIFVVGRGGTHHFRTPHAQGHSHPFHVLPVDGWTRPYLRSEAAAEPVTVVGQLCTPKDVLASEAMVNRVRVGDLLLFPYAGAYAWHISHHDFLRHPHPDQIFLSTQEALDVAAE